MHQKTPNLNHNIHFRPPGFLGGPWGGQNGFWASPGVFSEARALVFFLNAFILVHLTLLGGAPSQILTLPYYHTTLYNQNVFEETN